MTDATCLSLLQELVRIPTVNRGTRDEGDGNERPAAELLADFLRDAGLEPKLLEKERDRTNLVVRLKGTGKKPPLLLNAHLDVVEADETKWTHPPFGGEIHDGYLWGRGAIDMKHMAAMSACVMARLAAAAKDGDVLERDVIFAAVADEEAGCELGSIWLAEDHPDEVRAEYMLGEIGGFSLSLFGRTFYPIQVAEKGFEVYRITVRGTWGHGSMPRDDNAAVLAAEAVIRLATPGEPRLTTPMARFLGEVADAFEETSGGRAALVRAIGGDDPRRSDAALRGLCDPMIERALRALLRDTISPDIIRTGIKYNVIPGEATIEIDCRTLPGTTEADIREEILARLGDLGPRCEVVRLLGASPVEAPASGDLYELLAATIRAHDPDGIPVPVLAPFATDAKHTVLLDIPTYGFSPLRLAPDERFLERFHGVDERVGVDALAWGLPVLYDVVAAYCA